MRTFLTFVQLYVLKVQIWRIFLSRFEPMNKHLTGFGQVTILKFYKPHFERRSITNKDISFC